MTNAKISLQIPCDLFENIDDAVEALCLSNRSLKMIVLEPVEDGDQKEVPFLLIDRKYWYLLEDLGYSEADDYFDYNESIKSLKSKYASLAARIDLIKF